jgi:hypothetical protein
MTVDINPAMLPTSIEDGQKLPEEWKNRFYRWYTDPPYSEHAAEEMYRSGMPSVIRLLHEGARVSKCGGLLFLQWHPKSPIRIGWFCITVVVLMPIYSVGTTSSCLIAALQSSAA